MTSSRRPRITNTMYALALAVLAAGCRHDPPRYEGLDPEQMPSDVRRDYALFVLRCSKCHTLSRPLQSGITDDDFWAEYVERMRRQPSSGISKEDTIPILRFLHYFSAQELAKRAPPAPPAAAPPPSPPPQQDGGYEPW